MTESLLRGLTDRSVVEGNQVIITNRGNLERLARLSQQFGVQTSQSKSELIAKSDIVILACKPKDAPEILTEAGPLTRPGQVIISVMAGISTDLIQSYVHPGVQVIRAMPNTSCAVGESATAMALGSSAGPDAAQVSRQILGAVGTVVEVPESLLDAVTGLSGTGPAYIYFMLEAMIEAGKAVGIPAETARDLCLQTLKGAAKMLDQTGEDPAVLRQKVTSPNGTTMAGIAVLTESGFTQSVVRAVGQATQRSREMGVAASTPRAVTG